MKNLINKVLGKHEHNFKYVKLLNFEPLSPDSLYAKYTELWKCSCGEEKVVATVALI